MRGLARRLAFAAAAWAALPAATALAYEYPLTYTPQTEYEDLAVAGYRIVNKLVIGNCSYTAITPGAAGDPLPTYTPVTQTCTWNPFGSLLSISPGAPTVPAPLETDGTETIYAKNSAHLYTGIDAALTIGGFVSTYGAHYEWLTSNAALVLPPQPYTFTATVLSNGDIPLNVTGVKAFTRLRGATATVEGTTCTGVIPPGGTCDVTVTYDDTALASPTGLAHDALTIRLFANAGVIDRFVQEYTDEVPTTAAAR